MTPDQKAFVAFHARHLVTSWRWVFQGSTLIAEAESSGAKRAISAFEFGGLVDAGLIDVVGCAGVRLTERGQDESIRSRR